MTSSIQGGDQGAQQIRQDAHGPGCTGDRDESLDAGYTSGSSPLTERESQAGIIRASFMEVTGQRGPGSRSGTGRQSSPTFGNSLRDPANPQARLWDSIEEMSDQLGAR